MQISVQIGLDWNWPTGTELGNKVDTLIKTTSEKKKTQKSKQP